MTIYIYICELYKHKYEMERIAFLRSEIIQCWIDAEWKKGKIFLFRFAASIPSGLYLCDNCRSRRINRFHRDRRKWKGRPVHPFTRPLVTILGTRSAGSLTSYIAFVRTVDHQPPHRSIGLPRVCVSQQFLYVNRRLSVVRGRFFPFVSLKYSAIIHNFG